jgi:hypothetical protein
MMGYGLAKKVRAGASAIRATRIRGLVVPGLAALALLVASCAETFGDKLREHRNCVGEAHIEPEKVDTCLRDTNGHRDRIDLCLIDQMAPDSRVQLLNECVEAHEVH